MAEACADAWFRGHGSGQVEIALSTVAAVAFIRPPDADAHTLIERTIAEASPGQVGEIIAAQWRMYLNARPDLANPIYPLMAPWFGEHGPSTIALKAAKATAQAALKAGIHTIHPHDADLLGPLLTLMRTGREAQARGQYYTPASVATMMVGLTGAPREGESVHEPACGTGGMLRALAEAMRLEGRDPATVTWAAVDIDPLAVGCLAANVVLWELGPRVLLGVGNSLTDEWITDAQAQRRETVELARTVRTVRAMQALTTAAGGHAPGPFAEGPAAAGPSSPAPAPAASAPQEPNAPEPGAGGTWEAETLF
ncbi:N-6 DNA methylase [Streptomonospora litoralis]|uniref:N-6 DNA methylase n=1 Tax=Streptomonospora litoralis TaxID=2498135 RepID=UPI00103564E0|nr:N-6 DNA methylase [Streptomonospora litoralis]